MNGEDLEKRAVSGSRQQAPQGKALVASLDSVGQAESVAEPAGFLLLLEQQVGSGASYACGELTSSVDGSGGGMRSLDDGLATTGGGVFVGLAPTIGLKAVCGDGLAAGFGGHSAFGGASPGDGFGGHSFLGGASTGDFPPPAPTGRRLGRCDCTMDAAGSRNPPEGGPMLSRFGLSGEAPGLGLTAGPGPVVLGGREVCFSRTEARWSIKSCWLVGLSEWHAKRNAFALIFKLGLEIADDRRDRLWHLSFDRV